MRTRLDRSELVVFVGTGLFAIAVFAIALYLMAQSEIVQLGGRRLVGFVLGFALFMGSYFVAWLVWDWLHGDSQQAP